MLNYIKAELWKVFRRKSCYVLAALLLFTYWHPVRRSLKRVLRPL